VSIRSAIAAKWHERRDPVTDWVDDPWDDPGATYLDSVELLRRRPRVVPRIAFGIAVVLVAAALVAGWAGMWFLREVNPPGAPGASRQFIVVDGDTVTTVSERLEEEGFIVNAGVFEYYVNRNGGLELEPGSYTLRPNDHAGNVMQVLSTPPSETYVKITFPEGFTVQRMADRLAAQIPTMSADAFVAAATALAAENPLLPEGSTSAEGILFPDTYYVSAAETESHFVGRMIGLTERVSNQLDFAGGTFIPDYGLATPYDVLIVASLVEREAKIPEDRPKIARVIWNRLKIGMPLEIDAALLYGQAINPSIDQTLGPTALRVIDTPFNVYMHTGLPPTPIANPGRASIEAALDPAPKLPQGDPMCRGMAAEDCMLLFYVLADSDGGHAFAVTYEQHLANIAAARAAGIPVG
jgi:UPF0755 protein